MGITFNVRRAAGTTVGTVVAATAITLSAVVPSWSAAESQVASSRRTCEAGVVSKDVQSASATVSSRRVELLRVTQAKGTGFDASARVRVGGKVKATVAVSADACPGGKSHPALETRAVTFTGTRSASVKATHSSTKPASKRAAVKKATVKATALVRAAGIAAATTAAKKAALETSAAGAPTSDPTPVPTPTPPPPVSDAELEAFRVKVRTAVIKYTNIERAKVGVAPLVSLTPVTGGAQRWAQQMTDEGVLHHDSAAGIGTNPGVENCTEETDITEIVAGFALAPGLSDAAADLVGRQVVDAWVASPGHFTSMTDAAYSRTGVGVGLSPAVRAGNWNVGLVQRPWGGVCPQYAD